MLEEMASSTDRVVLYIPLLNEGTDVLRPTKGIVLGSELFQVLATSNYDPGVEEWEFPPGSKVRCVAEVRGGGVVLVARQRVA